jgi:hypothetical protein
LKYCLLNIKFYFSTHYKDYGHQSYTQFHSIFFFILYDITKLNLSSWYFLKNVWISFPFFSSFVLLLIFLEFKVSFGCLILHILLFFSSFPPLLYYLIVLYFHYYSFELKLFSVYNKIEWPLYYHYYVY